MAATKKKNNEREGDRMVTIEVTTTKPLPVGQQVFVSGNIEMFGSWRPDGFPLTRLDDNVWTGYAVVSSGLPVEFKITRGTWGSEEAEATGQARRENLKLPGKGNVSFKHTVLRWIDRE